jgi:hypothetical protein
MQNCPLGNGNETASLSGTCGEENTFYQLVCMHRDRSVVFHAFHEFNVSKPYCKPGIAIFCFALRGCASMSHPCGRLLSLCFLKASLIFSNMNRVEITVLWGPLDNHVRKNDEDDQQTSAELVFNETRNEGGG